MGDVEKRGREEEAILQMSKVTKVQVQISKVAKTTLNSSSISFVHQYHHYQLMVHDQYN